MACFGESGSDIRSADAQGGFVGPVGARRRHYPAYRCQRGALTDTGDVRTAEPVGLVREFADIDPLGERLAGC